MGNMFEFYTVGMVAPFKSIWFIQTFTTPIASSYPVILSSLYVVNPLQQTPPVVAFTNELMKNFL